MKPPGDRRFWSMFPLARVPFGVPIFDPQPCGDLGSQAHARFAMDGVLDWMTVSVLRSRLIEV